MSFLCRNWWHQNNFQENALALKMQDLALTSLPANVLNWEIVLLLLQNLISKCELIFIINQWKRKQISVSALVLLLVCKTALKRKLRIDFLAVFVVSLDVHQDTHQAFRAPLKIKI